MTDEISVAEALSVFSRHCAGQMNVLVNNAGVLFGGNFGEMEVEKIDAMLAVNIAGITRVAHKAFPLLKATDNSVLINTCSASSVYGFPILAVYCPSKFYVRGFTEALNIEWAKYGIHVCCIKPPYVSTAMFDDVPPEATQQAPAYANVDVSSTIEIAVINLLNIFYLFVTDYNRD